jgi:hypothetical protein
MSREYSLKHWKSLPRPNCCEKIVENPIIHLSALTIEGEREVPKWIMDIQIPYSKNVSNQVVFIGSYMEMINCPFCAAKLPEVELKTKIPQKVLSITDGGYYCNSCKERCQCCRCYPMEAKYQIRKV